MWELTNLALASSWPPRRDSLYYDTDWLLHIRDLWRSCIHGVPSVFA